MMPNHIANKINKIFSDELNYNRNSKLIKSSTSNKVVRSKFRKDQDKNYELIRQFNKRQSEQEDIFKEKMKFSNENNDNDISIKKGKKKLSKEENDIKNFVKKKSKVEINYLDNDNDFLFNKKDLERIRFNSLHTKKNKELDSGISNRDSKKIKKTKFNLGEKKPEESKNNQSKLKRKKTNTKRGVPNIVMIEKQKYPKKETIFDRIKGSINQSNKEISNDDDMHLNKGIKKNTSLKTKKIFNESIKMFDANYKLRDSTRTKKPGINIIKNSEKKITGEKDSSNFIKLNLDLINDIDSIYSDKSNTIKSIGTNNSKNVDKKLKTDNKNSENDFFHSSQFSNESKSKEESKHSPNNKNDIFLNKDSINKSNKMKSNQNFQKINDKNDSRKKMKKNYNNLNIYDNKSNNKSKNNSFIDSSSIDSESDCNENNNNDLNKQKDSNFENSINKKVQHKYNHGEGVLSIIPEQENKKRFYEDINQNIETIKPENIITLEQNLNRDKNISRNLEIKKNNIIINNNVSNNITVHKKESDSKNEDTKKEKETDKENNESKKGKPNKIKARKKFPFCCL